MSSGLQKHSRHLGQLNKKKFLGPLSSSVTYSVTTYTVTSVNVAHVCIVVLDNLGLQNIPRFVSEITLSCRWVDGG
jgi:hypothetical protein